MDGIICKKIGMTSIFNDAGKNVSCTIIEAEPNVVTQVKTEETDGYYALQIGVAEAKSSSMSKAMLGHFKAANTGPKKKIVELKNSTLQKNIGETIAMDEIFAEGDIVEASGTSKGKGFQGVVKRHGFGGVGDATHGQHNRQRAPGSIGAASYPAKVVKGMKMAGRTGGNKVTVKNLEIIKMLPEKNILLVKGAIPGKKGAFVIIKK